MTKSSNSPKTPRRKRKPRLHISSAEGLTFDPSDDDWSRIDKAYPFLSEADHETITGIANEYLSLAQFELNALFRDDVVAWLEATEKSARTFLESTSGEGDTIFYAQNYVARRIDNPALWHELRSVGNVTLAHIEHLRTILGSAVSTFATAKSDISKKVAPGFVGFVEGESWDAMICHLSDFAKGKGYPATASKGVDKVASFKTSPFVAFIRELQNTFPVELRRHSASDIAIAEAISVARRKWRAAEG